MYVGVCSFRFSDPPAAVLHSGHEGEHDGTRRTTYALFQDTTLLERVQTQQANHYEYGVLPGSHSNTTATSDDVPKTTSFTVPHRSQVKTYPELSHDPWVM